MSDPDDTQATWVDLEVQPTDSIRNARPLRERILKVLIAQSGLFIHVIAQRVDADPKRVGQELRGLMADGAVFKRKEHQGTYFKYYLLEGYFEPATPVKLRIDESVEVLHRLTLLKRMRDRLINEHHYLLDAVIRDYENTLVEPDDE